jgi:hypothetical protein
LLAEYNICGKAVDELSGTLPEDLCALAGLKAVRAWC